jgi:hypothetical protein
MSGRINLTLAARLGVLGARHSLPNVYFSFFRSEGETLLT